MVRSRLVDSDYPDEIEGFRDVESYRLKPDSILTKFLLKPRKPCALVTVLRTPHLSVRY